MEFISQGLGRNTEVAGMVSFKSDHSTIHLACSRLRIRDDLIFIPQPSKDGIGYHIEVPSESRYFRIGYAEYCFVSLLDGENSFAQALTVTAQQLGPAAIDQQQALSIVSWLIENRLATVLDTGAGHNAHQSAGNPSSILSKCNPFWIKIPLCHPDRMLSAILPWIAWLLSWPACLACCGLSIFAFCTVAWHWDRFAADSQIVFSPDNWLWMLAAWLVLKVFHEVGHGITCKYYGGKVREMGVAFVLLVPMAYVDVTTSWRFPCKWQRIHVAAAGMYIELLIASMAAICWSCVESQIAAHMLYNIVVMASVSTLAFNLNPLMRFDGYYMISDLLEIPNLYAEAAHVVQNGMGRLLLGSSSQERRHLDRWTSWLIGTYGVAALVWRIGVCISLILVASAMFHGAGVALAAAGIFGWFYPPWIRVVEVIRRRYVERPHTLVRAGIIVTCAVLTAVIALVYCPHPGTVTAQGIVDYQDLAVVRNTVPGFIEKVHVSDGQCVEAGDLLLEIRNDELSTDYQDLILADEQIAIRYRVALDNHQITAAQIELRNREALRQRLVEKQRKYDSLQVRAPVAGRVVARQLLAMDGTYVKEGHELLAIGLESSKELVLSIGHQQIDEILPAIGSSVDVRVGSRPRLKGMLKRIEPRATKQLPHPAMSAADGGPLAVTATEQNGDRRSLELVEPHFRAVVSLTENTPQSLFCGERGYAIIGFRQSSICSDLNTRVQQWIRAKFREKSPKP